MIQVKRDEAFFAAMHAEMWRYKAWIFRAFTFVTGGEHTDPFDIYQNNGIWMMNYEGDVVELVDELGKHIPSNVPVYKLNGKVTITPENIPFLREPSVETRYGKIILNYIMLYDPLGDKAVYDNVEISAKRIETDVYGKGMLLYSTNPEDPNAITVEQYKKFGSNVAALEGFSSLCVPSSTPKSLQTHPEMKKMIKEFLAKNKDKLRDPVVAAQLDALIVKLDKEWLKGDPSMRFLLNETKVFNVGRKAMYGSIGAKAGMGDGDELEFIEQSLADGVDIKTLHVQHNETRSASYNRGVQTAMGGSSVKDIMLITQNVKIIEYDCGTKLGVNRMIRNDNKNRFLGLYYIGKDTKPILITETNIKELVDKTILSRSTAYCKSQNFCEVCMGIHNSRMKTGLAAEASSMASGWMNTSMKAMHGKVMQTVYFDFKKWMH